MTNMAGLTYDTGTNEPLGDENVFGGQNGFGDLRVSVFDFGAGYADLRVVATWSYTRSFAPVPTESSGYSALWWDANITGTTFDGGDGDVAETTLNFFSTPGGTASNTWYNDVQLTEETAITPSQRYLKVTVPATFPSSNIWSEAAFVGFAVPEPTSALLLVLGGMTFLGRRRAS